jgi:hypothetical protein
MNTTETVCPGCGLTMPKRDTSVGHEYINASPECWSVYTEVLETEYSNALLFAQVHQLTVDTYAAQHAGGKHPDKSLDIHLSGLYLVLEQGRPQSAISRSSQRLATDVKAWPHFTPPEPVWTFTIFDVALAESHFNAVKEWSAVVWKGWAAHHAAIAEFVAAHLPDVTLRG